MLQRFSESSPIKSELSQVHMTMLPRIGENCLIKSEYVHIVSFTFLPQLFSLILINTIENITKN